MIGLHIKGTMTQAVEALNKRGLDAFGAREVGGLKNKGQLVYCQVSDEALRTVMDWFSDAQPLAQLMGYDPGTLMLYTLDVEP